MFTESVHFRLAKYRQYRLRFRKSYRVAPLRTNERRRKLMEGIRPLFIPAILGTTRKGRMSLHVCRLLTQELAKQSGVETELMDIATLSLPTGDAGEAIKDASFSAKMDRADGLVVVAPEYNHGYSGLLKHVLDSCLKEYIHKAVGLV